MITTTNVIIIVITTITSNIAIIIINLLTSLTAPIYRVPSFITPPIDLGWGEGQKLFRVNLNWRQGKADLDKAAFHNSSNSHSQNALATRPPACLPSTVRWKELERKLSPLQQRLFNVFAVFAVFFQGIHSICSVFFWAFVGLLLRLRSWKAPTRQQGLDLTIFLQFI